MKHRFLLMILSLLLLAGCCKQNGSFATDPPEGMDHLTVTAQELTPQGLVSTTYQIPAVDGNMVLDVLDLANTDLTTDVLKSEFTLSYTLILSDTQTLIINRIPEPGSSNTYVHYMHQGAYLAGGYVNAEVITLLDDLLSELTPIDT